MLGTAINTDPYWVMTALEWLERYCWFSMSVRLLFSKGLTRTIYLWIKKWRPFLCEKKLWTNPARSRNSFFSLCTGAIPSQGLKSLSLIKIEKRLALIAVVLAIIAAGIAGATLLNGSPNQTETNSFITQPVLDIIIPSLFHETSTGGINSPLNASAGQSISLTVQLFPSTNLNVSMQFRYFLMNSSSSSISPQGNASSLSAMFHPLDLTIAGGKTANVTMDLAISASTVKSHYTSVISAVNLQNSSQVWGVIMQIDIA